MDSSAIHQHCCVDDASCIVVAVAFVGESGPAFVVVDVAVVVVRN